MTSRITKFLLIDGKTSGTETSNQINELDPRGGAAITGKNGVGKTTSLQLTPLFFGVNPSRIVPHGPTKKSMMEFMLPHPSSAIAFEYQRGVDPSDLRLIVIRKQIGSSAPDYRFFKCGFRADLFMKPHGVNGEMRFLDDSDSVRSAIESGITVTGKLSTAQYRSVILKTRSVTKEADQLKRLAQDYSFAHRSLQNMDSLIAAAVQEKIDFKDLISVVVSSVQDEMGTDKDNKVQVKNMREQMERWIATRDAAEAATKLAPKIQKLFAAMDDYRKYETKLQSQHADVLALEKIKAHLLLTGQASLLELSEKHDQSVEAAKLVLAQLKTTLNEASEGSARAFVVYQGAKARSDHFEQEEAALWAQRVKEIPQLQEQVAQTSRALDLAKSRANDIVRQIEEELSKHKEKTATELDRIESEKSAPNDVFTQSSKNQDAQQQIDRQALRESQDEAMEVVNATYEELVQKHADAKARIHLYADSAEDVAQLKSAEELLEQLIADLEKCRSRERENLTQVNTAKRELIASQHNDDNARLRLEAAEKDFESAKLAQRPPAGTLMASLHDNSDQSWRGAFARVINPELLMRTDLSAIAPADDMGSGIFGWMVPTDHIETPSWANAEQSAIHLARKSEIQDAAKDALNKASTEVARSAANLKKAELEYSSSEALLSIASRKCDTQKGTLTDVKARMHRARADSTQTATANAAQIESQMLAQRRIKEELKRKNDQMQRDLEAGFSEVRKNIQGVRDAAIQSIDQRKNNFRGERLIAEQQLLAQRERRLIDAEVDVKHVYELEARRNQMTTKLEELENKRALVKDFELYHASGEAAELPLLWTRVTESAQKAELSKNDLAQHLASRAKAVELHEVNASAMKKSVSMIKDNLDELALLKANMVDYQPFPSMISLVTQETTVSELQGVIRNSLGEHNSTRLAIEHDANSLEAGLTKGANQVTDLISGILAGECLGENISKMHRARVLCDAYTKISEQVIIPLNTELGTMLEILMTVRDQVNKFESGVRSFDRKLQVGIENVVGPFERLKDFKINVVTNFAEVDFLKQLKDMEDIAREYRAINYMSRNTSIPNQIVRDKMRAIVNKLEDGQFELDLGRYVELSGSANDDGNIKPFHNEAGLRNLSSTGITAIAMITLLSGMLNVIRGSDDIYLPWATDEVTRFDSGNFSHLMEMLRDNKIDVITASPHLAASSYSYFQNRYLFERGSEWAVFNGNNAVLEQMNIAILAEKDGAAL